MNSPAQPLLTELARGRVCGDLLASVVRNGPTPPVDDQGKGVSEEIGYSGVGLGTFQTPGPDPAT